jgi:hypothetical protein
LIAPVRLRWVASGLMIEKVRSTAIDIVLDWKTSGEACGRLIARAAAQRQDAARRRPHRPLVSGAADI